MGYGPYVPAEALMAAGFDEEFPAGSQIALKSQMDGFKIWIKVKTASGTSEVGPVVLDQDRFNQAVSAYESVAGAGAASSSPSASPYLYAAGGLAAGFLGVWLLMRR